MKAVFILPFLTLFMNGCASTFAGNGLAADGEKISAEIIYPADGSLGGPIVLAGDRGTTCRGRWNLGKPGEGDFMALCDDNQGAAGAMIFKAGAVSIVGRIGRREFFASAK